VNLCSSCGLDFASVSAFDKHRAGRHAYTLAEGLRLDPPREDGRRCLDLEEFAVAGLGLGRRGRWSLTADAARAHARFAEVPHSAPGVLTEATEGVGGTPGRVAA
jgi:hypothetical protein